MPDYNCYFKSSAVSNGGTHSLQADPLFNDTSKLDLSLRTTSPCIDKEVMSWEHILISMSNRYHPALL